MIETYIKSTLIGGLFDGMQEYVNLNVREVIVPCLPLDDEEQEPPLPGEWTDGSTFRAGIHGELTEDDLWRPFPLAEFVNMLQGFTPDYPVYLYRVRKGYPGTFFFVGPWSVR